MTALGRDASRAFSHLRTELVDVKLEREVLESTVLTLSAAVTSLMEQAVLGPLGGITQLSLDERLGSTTRQSTAAWTQFARK